MSNTNQHDNISEEDELLDCSFHCMKCFGGHYSYHKNRICFRCKIPMLSNREIKNNERIANAFKVWYETIKDTDIDKFAVWYIQDRFKMILEDLKE